MNAVIRGGESPDPVVARYGTALAEPQPRRIELGPLSCTWAGGALRWIRWRECEAVRGVAAVLRDPHWGTHEPHIDDECLEVSAAHARLRQRFHLEAEEDRSQRLLEGELRVEADVERIDVDLVLRPLAPFVTARSGLSVLLPLVGVAGAPIDVEHSDGRRESTRLPALISPSQPLREIRRLCFSPGPDLSLELAFQGDVFEMEDQRNWSDASFKVYNRPLAWPTPYRLQPGETIEQRVTISRVADTSAAP